MADLTATLSAVGAIKATLGAGKINVNDYTLTVTPVENGTNISITRGSQTDTVFVPDYTEDEERRVTHENARITNEKSRETAEDTRDTEEAKRQTAEAARADAEGKRTDAETARATAEADRDAAETERVDAESKRVTAESTRETAEKKRSVDIAELKIDVSAIKAGDTERDTRITAIESKDTEQDSEISTLKTDSASHTSSIKVLEDAATVHELSGQIVNLFPDVITVQINQCHIYGKIAHIMWQITMSAPITGQNYGFVIAQLPVKSRHRAWASYGTKFFVDYNRNSVFVNGSSLAQGNYMIETVIIMAEE